MKQRLSPEICYIIGLCNRKKDSLYISTKEDLILKKFTEIIVKWLGINPGKIKIIIENENITAYSYNSRVMKFFNEILKKRQKAFKYMNDYSSNYLSGLFDSRGFEFRNNLYFNYLDLNDQMILENLHIHLKKQNNAYCIISQNLFVIFTKQNSIKISLLEKHKLI